MAARFLVMPMLVVYIVDVSMIMYQQLVSVVVPVPFSEV
jgi:hypothetical protein